jgi:hypothetical protein
LQTTADCPYAVNLLVDQGHKPNAQTHINIYSGTPGSKGVQLRASTCGAATGLSG